MNCNLPLRMFTALSFGLALLPGLGQAAESQPPQPTPTPMSNALAFVGTYTGPKSEGIYVFGFDLKTGAAQSPRLAAPLRNPSFLALHPKGQFLYAVSEVSDTEGRPSGVVAAYAITSPTGELKLLNQAASGGRGPCHLTVHPTGRCLFVANYGGGSVAALPLRPDGSLGASTHVIQHEGKSLNPQRQEGPHAHGVTLDPKAQRLFVPDLGLDQVRIYQIDLDRAALSPNAPPAAEVMPGSGPRHFGFHPTQPWAYVINELTSTITAFRYDAATGALEPRQTLSTLPEGFRGNSTTAEIAVHPAGHTLYGSNRGHDSLAVFAIDPLSGELRLLEHVPTAGRTPRNFALTPDGAWLWAANQGSDSLVLFRVDPQTGRLTAAGPTLEVGAPVCIVYLTPPRAPRGLRTPRAPQGLRTVKP